MIYSLPARIGKRGRTNATDIAGIACDAAQERVGMPLAVMCDRDGRIWVDFVDDALPDELFATIDHRTDEFWLAGEIRLAWSQCR